MYSSSRILMTNYLYKTVVTCVATVIFSLYALLATQNNESDLKIEITGLRDDQGFVLLSLYNNKDGFPSNAQGAYWKDKVKIKDRKAYFICKALPAGTYAIAVLHDENSNLKMDTKFLGLPKEGYGFSENPRLMFGPPSFKSASFQHLSEQSITIVMKY